MRRLMFREKQNISTINSIMVFNARNAWFDRFKKSCGVCLLCKPSVNN